MGLATATILASLGAIVSLADLNEKALSNAAASLEGGGQRHLCTVVDVRQAKAVEDWIQATVTTFGRLDGAVNMAGVITHAAPFAQTSDDEWSFNMDINATGVFHCLRAELKAMKDGASIVSSPCNKT